MIKLLLFTLSLYFLIGVVANSGRDKKTKTRLLFGLLGVGVLLYGSVVFKVSFFYEWIDYVFLILLVFAGPLLLLLETRFKSSVSMVVSWVLFITFFCAIGFASAFFYLFRGTGDVELRKGNGTLQVIKITTLGGTTADCNYEVRRTVTQLIIFERQSKYEKILLTPDLPECKDK